MRKATDFKILITSEFINNRAISHLEAWKERYNNYTRKREARFDLNVNHDPSLEIENAEEILGRKLSDNESTELVE